MESWITGVLGKNHANLQPANRLTRINLPGAATYATSALLASGTDG